MKKRLEYRPAFIHTYRVIGKGQFPIDMLRHDQAYPASTDSAFNIVGEGQRHVDLQSYIGPTEARWASFGWIVDHGE